MGVWAAIAISHVGLLRLPYYWDEAGYYIPAAFDFFRLRTLVPVSTLSNAHPPLPSIYLAACWAVFGFHPLVTRLAVAAISALGLLAVYRLATHLISVRSVAIAVTALTMLYPVWFAQSTLAHADIFAAAATLWGLAFLCEEPPRFWPAGICFAIAALSKETAVITPLALLSWLAWKTFRGNKSDATRQTFALLLAPTALACWYAYHWHRTGFIFGNPEYLRYNAVGTFHAAHILYAAWLRVWHVAGHMNLWVATLLTLCVWLLPPRDIPSTIANQKDVIPSERKRVEEPAVQLHRARQILLVTFFVNLAAFSFLGGAILTRYVLPLFPLVLLFHVAFWRDRTRWWPLAAFVTAVAFIAGLFFDPPYQFAAEDNLSYAAAIRVEQQAISRLVSNSAAPPTIVTAWPVSDYLAKPELGYVQTPVPVVTLKNFSLQQLLLARQQHYDAALIFYQTRPAPLLAPLSSALPDASATADLPAPLAARLLGGEIEWQALERRHYAAVVQRNGPVDAQSAPANFIMAAR